MSLNKTLLSGLYALLLISGMMASALANDADMSRQLTALREAHQQAIELSLSHPSKGRLAHARVAGRLESLLDEQGSQMLDGGALAYNIGNSWYHAGQYGKSILWYRRAQEQGFNTPELEHNLRFVRSSRLDDLPELFGDQWLSDVYLLAGSPFWLALSALIYLVFWRQLWALLSGRSQSKGRLYGVVVGLVLVSASLVFRLAYSPPESDGVITSMHTTARKGPGLIFAPAFTSPLNQGTEFILLQEQGRWREVSLSNGRTAWLIANSTTLL